MTRIARNFASLAAIALATFTPSAVLAGRKPPQDIVIANAVIMTVTAPADARIVDAGGRYLTPGIVEADGHIGMGGLYDPHHCRRAQAGEG
jgi:imidazolonepropionase-like amidohydrolase